MPESKFLSNYPVNHLYKQLERVLSENSIEDVLDTLALVVEEADEWVDPTFQTFATEQIRNAATQLRDEDWVRNLEGDDAQYMKEATE